MFQACYQPRPTFTGGVDWTCVGLPYVGGVADQPAWLMEAFDYLRAVFMRLGADRIREHAKKARPAKRPRRG